MNIRSCFFKLVIFVMLSSVQALGQSSNDPEFKYGKSFEAYEIRPSIMMRIQKDATKQVSEIRIERFSGSDSAVHIGKTIDAYMIKEIIDELVPIEVRGAQGEYFGLTLLLGQAWSASYDYEFVSIRLLGSINFSKSNNSQTESRNKRQRNNPYQSAEVILIKWKNT